MELHNLTPSLGSNKSKRRIARGEGSGSGDTAGKGHKGAKARTGHNEKRGHEGGQMPLQMRIPKRGFKNPTRVEYAPVNLSQLQALVDKNKVTEFNVTSLIDFGFCSKNDKIKILSRGELTAKISVEAHAISESAKAAIEALGGSVSII
jgi:large subunit ribosomal protein L15